jgi:hypothetical protein
MTPVCLEEDTMPRPYDEELVIAESEDGIFIQGAVIQPCGDRRRPPGTVSSTAAVRLIDGADHVYTGHEQEVARVIVDWIAGLGK